ncbi:hypothetical protein LJC34_06255 [Oscillospiraceae bacterium OttesenSCG-928-G22]|nr:hypothetical protein [Oscillospiraceae bacterium OttesenSCG-928-G22]
MSKSSNQKNNPNEIELPQSIIDSYARFLVPKIRRFYESEEGKQALEEYLKKQQEDQSST